MKKHYLLIALAVCTVSAQTWDFKHLRRGKLWATMWNSGVVGYPVDECTLFGNYYDYPGYTSVGDCADSFALCGHSGYAVHAKKNDVARGYTYYSRAYPSANYMTITSPSAEIKNYGMLDQSIDAELIVTGGHYIHWAGVQLDMRHMQWSYPDLDDFIIHEYHISNPDTATNDLTDLYFSPRHAIKISLKGEDIGPGDNQDDKYGWLEEEDAFYFYDERSFNWETEVPVTFNHGPGPERGDFGDAADIMAGDAATSELLSPQYMSIIMLDAAGGTVVQNITDAAGQGSIGGIGVPARDESMILNWGDNSAGTWEDQIIQILTFDQQRDSYDNLVASGGEASKYERSPEFFISSGPHTLAPGQSIKLVYAVVVGTMDRAKVVEGGVANIDLLHTEGVAALRQNIANAKALYAAGYDWPDPPPSVDDIALTPIGGGVEVSWPAVDAGYRDPGTTADDFAGYRVYTSNYFSIGPWTLLKDIPKADASVSGGNVTYTHADMPLGVGAYYYVTTYDTDGNESGETGANRFPVYPLMAVNTNFPNDRVHVVPNPFRVKSGLVGSGEQLRMDFINLPAQAHIRIYTLAGDLVKTIDHDDGSGSEAWGSVQTLDYQTNDWLLYIQPGFYIYHVESKLDGKEFIGKFAIIK